MRECAAQTDLVAKRSGWVEGHRTGDTTIAGWQSHYSPKYQHCYVQVTYINHPAENNRDLPPLYDELWDAFEGKSLAICTDATNASASRFCTLQDGPSHFDCKACREFVEDRMKN